MSPEQRWAHRIVVKLITGQILATAALFIGVWVVGAQTKTTLRSDEKVVRILHTEQLRSACVRNVHNDFEAYGTNRDLAQFAQDAAEQRAADGNAVTAREYRQREQSARARMATIKARLPAHGDEVTITLYCRDLYPVPHP